jgi:large subunit ribosomal protein L25
MATRYRTAQQLRRLPIVDRFVIREGRAQELDSELRHPVNPLPFHPFKNESTGRWMPPRYSLRRQAQLGKEAYKQVRFQELTQIVEEIGSRPGIKLGKMKERIEELQADGSRGGLTIPVSAPAAATLEDLEGIALTKSARQTKMENDRRAVAQAKALAATRGPYSGRSLRNIFKGTKADRDAPAKRRRTAERLSTMEQTVETWRKVRVAR